MGRDEHRKIGNSGVGAIVAYDSLDAQNSGSTGSSSTTDGAEETSQPSVRSPRGASSCNSESGGRTGGSRGPTSPLGHRGQDVPHDFGESGNPSGAPPQAQLPALEEAVTHRKRARPLRSGTHTAPGAGTTRSTVKVSDFFAYMPTHQYIYVPTRELWPAASVNARVPMDGIKASAWIDRYRAVDQMTWAPGLPVIVEDRLVSGGGWIARKGARVFNLYMPPIPVTGDPEKATPWLTHIRRVYPGDAEHIIRWLAHRVQKPGEKINHALLLGGKQGIGKDTILVPVSRAIGPWNLADVSPSQLTGRFTGFLKSVILRVSEGRDLGDVDRYSFYEHLKIFTAAPPDVIRVDEKYIREHAVFNTTSVIITTNHKTGGMYLPSDDRRHYVAWSALSKEDFTTSYWNKLWEWYQDEGLEHVGSYLASIDISQFDAKAPPPKTRAFWDIVDANRAPEESELADVLDTLGNPKVLTLADLVSRAPKAFREWLQDRRNRRQIPHKLEGAGYGPVRNETAADGLWKIDGRRQALYARKELSTAERLSAAAEFVGRSRTRRQ